MFLLSVDTNRVKTWQICALPPPNNALHCSALPCTTVHCITLHCIELHCTAPHCTTLNWTKLNWTKLNLTKLNLRQLSSTLGYSTVKSEGWRSAPVLARRGASTTWWKQLYTGRKKINKALLKGNHTVAVKWRQVVQDQTYSIKFPENFSKLKIYSSLNHTEIHLK